MPGWESLRNGDISKKKKMTGTMLRGFYNSCYFPDPVSGDQFAADAIISNPPTFAHVHVAEALGLPLLMSFSEPSDFSPASTCRRCRADVNDSYAVDAYYRIRPPARQYSCIECRTWPDQLSRLRNGRPNVCLCISYPVLVSLRG